AIIPRTQYDRMDSKPRLCQHASHQKVDISRRSLAFVVYLLEGTLCCNTVTPIPFHFGPDVVVDYLNPLLRSRISGDHLIHNLTEVVVTFEIPSHIAVISQFFMNFLPGTQYGFYRLVREFNICELKIDLCNEIPMRCDVGF